jgi:putative zinc finger/helix-turn-helix YgiT family protein
MALAPVPFSTKVSHDGRQYDVEIPSLVVPKCSNCGNISLDEEANRAIDAAFRRQAKLLTPEEIRSGRERFNLSQQEFADLLGVSVSTLSRWETGTQIQQRVLNDYIKAFVDLPELRGYLKAIRCGRVVPVAAPLRRRRFSSKVGERRPKHPASNRFLYLWEEHGWNVAVCHPHRFFGKGPKTQQSDTTFHEIRNKRRCPRTKKAGLYAVGAKIATAKTYADTSDSASRRQASESVYSA